MAQDRACELGEEALDEVEPGAVLGREGELEAARRLNGEPSSGFFRDVRRMVVEDQPDRRTGRISGIEKLEEFDEFAAAVTLLDQGMNPPGKQIDSGQQAERAMTLVLIIAREGRVGARHRRQIRCRRRNRLDSRLLVVGDDRHRFAWFLRFGSGLFQNLDLAIDAQNYRHLPLELGIAAFQIVTHLVWLDFLVAEDLAHRSLHQVGETFVPRRRPVLAGMTCGIATAVAIRFVKTAAEITTMNKVEYLQED